MTKIDPGRIIGREKLAFANNAELRDHYEEVWANGGYSKGFVLNGIPLSQIYHQARQESALKLLESKRGERILDAGCGNGVLTHGIAEQAAQAYGVDVAYNAVRQAQMPNINVSQMNLEDLAFKDKSFDKVVCVETLEHVLNPGKVISEFYRVLSDDGRLVITYPFVNTNITAKRRIAANPGDYLSISEHLTEWDYDTLKERVESEGFNLVRSEGIVFELGELERLKKMSRGMTKAFTRAKLAIKGFPKNSAFASFLFAKR